MTKTKGGEREMEGNFFFFLNLGCFFVFFVRVVKPTPDF